MAGIFKAYDIRGTYPDQLDESTAFHVGYYFKDLLDEDDLALGPVVVVSRDMRSHSVPLAQAVKNGLRARGVAVIDIGIAESDRETISAELGRVLADTYTLYLKTHNYHWNVTGPMFNTLHLMFEEEYTDLAQAVDLIAERIRALGAYAPGSYAEFSKMTSVEEADEVPSATEMLRRSTSPRRSLAAF